MTPHDFVLSLGKLKDVTAQWKVLEAWLKKGERQKLIEVARLCVAAGQNEWQKRSMHDRILEMLALEKGRENIAALVEITSFSPSKTPFLAEIATQNQHWRDLLPPFDSPQLRRENRDFLAFLAQELVLRGHDLSETAARGFYESDLIPNGHELGVLPLFRLPCEAGFPAWRRHYGRGRSSWSYRSRSQRSAISIAGKTSQFSEIACETAPLSRAVANWCEESNGKVEARCFTFAPLQTEEFGLQTLKSFALQSLSDAQNLTLNRVDFSVALERLFQAACNGGAYNQGEYGALGRLKTWQSVAALCASESQDLETIFQSAQSCTWFEFSVSSEWYYQVAWDLGLACLRESGTSLAVLSATDTD